MNRARRAAAALTVALLVAGCGPMAVLKADTVLMDYTTRAFVLAQNEERVCGDNPHWSAVHEALERTVELGTAYAAYTADDAARDLTARAQRVVEKDAVLGLATADVCKESARNVQREYRILLQTFSGRER